MDTPASDILGRLNLEKIHNSVIWGREERGEPDPRSYDERLNAAQQKVIDCMSAMTNDLGLDAKEVAIQEVQTLLDTAKDVYTAIGIRVGAELAQQAIKHEGRKQEHKAPILRADPIPGTETHHGYPFDGDLHILHSKDFFARMKARVNLQSLGAYIRDGGTRARFYDKPFCERVDEANVKLEETIEHLVPDKAAASEVHDAISEYDSTIIDVYFSLGMKVGAQLDNLLMSSLDRDYS